MPEQEPSIKNQSKAKTTQARPASNAASRTAGGAAKAKPAASKTKAASTGGTRRTGTGGDLAERIRQRAYEIWEREGRPEGREQEHWEQAERELAKARPARQRDVAA